MTKNPEIKAKIELDGIRNIIYNALPQNATNRDVLKILFPSLNKTNTYENGVTHIYKPLDDKAEIVTNADWLYRPYNEK